MRKNAEKIIKELEEETRRFYDDVNNHRRIDKSFVNEQDAELSEDEIAQINSFWGKYKFAYPTIDYESFKTFKNRCGKFSVYHCPGAIRTEYFSKHFVNRNYSTVFQNKGMQEFLYSDCIQQPKSIIRKMNGIYYDENYEPITLSQAIELCNNYCFNTEKKSTESDKIWGGVIYKPFASSGGKGIAIIRKENANAEYLKKLFSTNRGFIVQALLKQSRFMEQFHKNSVNTIRITTLLYKGEFHPLAALIRFGNHGTEVDNWCSGGNLLGIDINTGKCLEWALANDLSHIHKLPSGIDLSKKNLIVPNFDMLKEKVKKAHYRIPYIKMISWDIALDDKDIPTMIECNFGGMIQIHEATTGPLFGELTEPLLDEYLLKQFHTRFATQDFICKEYHDHIVISEYIGNLEKAIIPETLHNKPITFIETNAFKNCHPKDIYASVKIMKTSQKALALNSYLRLSEKSIN